MPRRADRRPGWDCVPHDSAVPIHPPPIRLLRPLSRTGQDTLFEYVPWNIGIVHSGMLRALLLDSETADHVWEAIGLEPMPQGVVERRPQFEAAMGSRRKADLLVEIGARTIAFETKVEDPIRQDQLLLYSESGVDDVVLFAPTLSGRLFASQLPSPALTGDRLVAALGGLQLRPTFSSYMELLTSEHDRYAAAVAIVESGSSAEDLTMPPERGGLSQGSGADALVDAAWFNHFIERLDGLGEPDVKNLAHGRVLFYGASWRACEGGGVYIELTSNRSGLREVRIKGGLDGAGSSLPPIWEIAQAEGPPRGDWKRGYRRLSGGSVTLWKCEIMDPIGPGTKTAAEVAERWIDSVAGSQ